ncbi:VanZ family protein [Streptomyces zaomyceticus]|uniref:VanZ family protein n=1 Tax=Streptomyces zaomyceticus TaxID=68286 RepID=UPI002E16383C|nr:VanZ family protein [Streptomyces zaomyceticus]
MTSRIGWHRVTTEWQRKQQERQRRKQEESRRERQKQQEKQKEEERRKSSGAGPGPWLRAGVVVLALAAMVAFGVVLARLTLQPSPASEMLTHANLRPGDSIRAYLGQPAFRDTVKQLGGNILLGVPFGLLLPLVSPRSRGFVNIALLTVATMLLVELVQGALITGRAFDIDDVLLNTTGALLGYALAGRRLGRAVYPRRRQG